METLSTPDISEIESLVNWLSSTTGEGEVSGNILNTVWIEKLIWGNQSSLYIPVIIIIGAILRIIFRIIKEKIKANIRARTFEKRARKVEKKDSENKPNQEDVLKNIFNGIK